MESSRRRILLERGGYGKHLLLLPWPPDDLYPDWQPFRRTASGNDNGRIAQQVEKFRVAPGIEIVDRLAFNPPTALPVPECRDRSRRAQ